jgi:hypothetical protein
VEDVLGSLVTHALLLFNSCSGSAAQVDTAMLNLLDVGADKSAALFIPPLFRVGSRAPSRRHGLVQSLEKTNKVAAVQ